MKLQLEIDEVNHDVLNNALADISKLMNQHFVASGNKISLTDEKDDSFDSYSGKMKHTWLIKLSVEWMKVTKGK